MLEMTVEFVKTETSVENDDEYRVLWEQEGYFYSGNGTHECAEQRRVIFVFCWQYFQLKCCVSDGNV